MAYTPNYAALNAAEPGLISYRGSEQTALANAATRRRAAIQALQVQYGGLPSGFTDTYGDTTPLSGALAGENQYSTIAQRARQRQADHNDLIGNLAARGALHSGALLGGLNQENFNAGQQEYNAGLDFSNKYNAAIQAYLDTVNQQKQGEAGAIQTAAQDVYSNPMNRVASAPAPAAPVTPVSSAARMALGMAPSDHPLVSPVRRVANPYGGQVARNALY